MNWKRNDIKYHLVPDIPVSQVEISYQSEIMMPKMLFGSAICSAQLMFEAFQGCLATNSGASLVPEQTNLPNEHV